MSDSSLIPEQQLIFSPGLAATIGLEEAILLQQLHLLQTLRQPEVRQTDGWLRVSFGELQTLLPFWQEGDLVRIARSLEAKGVLRLRTGDPQALDFALHETGTAAAAQEPAPAMSPVARAPAGATRLPAGWQPGGDMLQLLQLSHGIPREFALQQLEDFRCYWLERGEISHAWENKFRQHVLTCWRRQQQATSFTPPEPEVLDNDWRPSEDALEILLRAGVDPDFIEEALPEFILYWRERGSAPKALNSKFVQHVRMQWTRFHSNLEHSTEPRRIPADWSPSEDAMDILRMSHIPPEFAAERIPEFVLYWRESNQLNTSWNSKFVQHVKYHWARQNEFPTQGAGHGGQTSAGGQGRTRDRSLEQDLNDTSWAD